MTAVFAVMASYLAGSIPFGLIIGKITKGIDIRDFGSGNIGATNVLRTLGLGPAIAVFFFDTAKGWFAVYLCGKLGLSPVWIMAGGLASVLGHTFSPFLRFRGGKGVATSLGVIVGFNPIIAAIAFVIWLLLVAAFRIISVASIIATVIVPLLMIFWKAMRVPFPYQITAVIAATAIIVKHIPNMKRLLNGTEPRVGQRVDISNKDRG